jgi:hypothetical protein
MIRANAALVVAEFGPLSGIPFGFDLESVAWVQGFIERQRENSDASEDARTRIAAVLACYLGEAIAAETGGRWDDADDGELGIRFANDNWCFPFAKVAKQFSNGIEGGDSILSFYTFALTIAARKNADQPSERGPSARDRN